MPIKIQADLPARTVLEQEHIFVMPDNLAAMQDIRPLKIAIVNLMPTKIATETQLLRLLGNTPLQVEVSLVRMEHHDDKNTSSEHLERFYITSADVFRTKFDGMIITGAPVEQLDFECVDYWNELCAIMDYARKNVFCTLFICWGALAGLYHNYGVPKHCLNTKLFGVLPYRSMTTNDALLRGFDDLFYIPQSRYATVRKQDLAAVPGLSILAESCAALYPNEAAAVFGNDVFVAKSTNNREVFVTGHLEYDTLTLRDEYLRDRLKGLGTGVPFNYFPENNPKATPHAVWRSCAHLFFSNWLNYYVYQETPFEFV